MGLSGAEIVKLLKEEVSAETEFALPHQMVDGVGVPRWTTYDPPTFIASVKPASTADLQQIVKCAVKNGIPFHAVATGHNYTTEFSKMRDVLEIDLRCFKDIAVDKAANTVTVGGAVTFSEVMEPVYAAGKEMPVGGCSSAGLVGVALGGGLNRWQGLYGLLIDNLISVEMVTSTGELIKASASENPELFWGMRGAGFNFGIVTSATFKTYDLRNGGEMLCADLILPFEKHSEVVKILKGLEFSQHPALSIAASANWSDEAGGPVLMFSGLYIGPVEEGKAHMQPFMELGPVVQNVRPIQWNKVFEECLFGADRFVGIYGMPLNIYTGHIKTFDLATFDTYHEELKKMWEKHPETRRSSFMIEDWATKATQDVPDDATAFAWRDVNCQMLLVQASTDPSLEPMLDDWARKARNRFQETSGIDEPVVYVSYAHGDENEETLYGKRKLERLRALKKKWDPEQVFSFNAGIRV